MGEPQLSQVREPGVKSQTAGHEELTLADVL
jgi:hypothetical protein